MSDYITGMERDQARAKCGELVTESNRLRAEIERWRDSNNRLREEMEHQSRRADEAHAAREMESEETLRERERLRAGLAAARRSAVALKRSMDTAPGGYVQCRTADWLGFLQTIDQAIRAALDAAKEEI